MWLPLLAVALLPLVAPSADSCSDPSERCASTNYETYVECVRRRDKRSVDRSGSNCIDTCNSCDCERCSYSGCGASCGTCCATCCANYMPCSTNHCCHKTCHSQCSTSQCRSSCRKGCFDTIVKNVTAQTTAQAAQIATVDRHNVTTIIHLNNVINNTNVVDIPITLNYTNEQNITLHAPQGGDANYSTGEKCCTVIGPRQCVSQPKPRCFHYRTKQCGPYCTASIVHKEQQQICESIYPQPQQSCRQQIVYIPQPQPRCFYQSVWPYVACGIQPPAPCAGCYGHYADVGSTSYLDCPSQCYDEGFALGPMYRQGPVYRPYYAHAPPCQALPCYDAQPQQYVAQPQPFLAQPQQFLPQQFLPQQFFPQGEPIEDVPLEDPSNSSAFEPLFRAGDVGVVPAGGPYRGNRDVEIEMNYKEPPKAQAQVKIRHHDKDGNGTTVAKPVGEKKAME